MNYIRIAIIILSIFIFNYCDNLDYLPPENIQQEDSNNNVNNEINKENPFSVKILKATSGKDIVFKISNPIGMSLVDIDIIGANFSNKMPISLKDIDPINRIELYDIDNDGFEELFIFTSAAGSGSYGSIYAFTSNKEVELTPINIDDFIFKGYFGHDSFIFEKNRLIRTFSVENNNKKRASIKYYYNGTSLKIEHKIEEKKLPTKG